MWETTEGPGSLWVWRRTVAWRVEVEHSREQEKGEIQFRSIHVATEISGTLCWAPFWVPGT